MPPIKTSFSSFYTIYLALCTRYLHRFGQWQIDLMFMYTPGGRDILGVSDSQMQSELADSVITVNEAMANSDIDLRFSLVRVEPVSLSLLKDNPHVEQYIHSRRS